MHENPSEFLTLCQHLNTAPDIWSLHDIIKSEEYDDLKEDPDFSFQVTGDDCDNSYAIVSDTGIMTRNVLTGKIDNFFDFFNP